MCAVPTGNAICFLLGSYDPMCLDLIHGFWRVPCTAAQFSARLRRLCVKGMSLQILQINSKLTTWLCCDMAWFGLWVINAFIIQNTKCNCIFVEACAGGPTIHWGKRVTELTWLPIQWVRAMPICIKGWQACGASHTRSSDILRGHLQNPSTRFKTHSAGSVDTCIANAG